MDTSLSESVVVFRAALQVVQKIQESAMYQLPAALDTYVGTVQESISRIEQSSLLRTAAVPHRASITVRKRAARATLREVHARPLCTMARVMERSVIGMVKLFHMPYDHLNDRDFIEAMVALVGDARQYRAVFVEKGCPPDFLERFEAAIDAFNTLIREQSLNQQYRATARGDQYQALQDGKGALMYLDAILSPILYENPRLLGEWRHAAFPNRKIGGAQSRRLPPSRTVQALPPGPSEPAEDGRPAALPPGAPAGRVIRRLLGRGA